MIKSKPKKSKKSKTEDEFEFQPEENDDSWIRRREAAGDGDEGFETLYEDPGSYASIALEDESEEKEVDDKLIEPSEALHELDEDPVPEIVAGLTHPAEIAARYLKTHGKGPVGGSDAQILKDLRKMVFGVPLLPQVEVYRLFSELDKYVYPTVYRILATSNVFWESVVQVIIKVAAGNTYGKNIYEKEDLTLEEKGQKKTYKELFKDHEITFLLNSYQTMRLFVQTKTTGEPTRPTKIQEAMSKCAFIRGVYEDILTQFVGSTSKYIDLHWKAMQSKIDSNHDDYSKQIGVIRLVDENLGLNKHAFAVARDAQVVFHSYQNTRSIIIAPYLRSVYSAAKKTARNAHQMLDNFQNGSIGLMRAVSCYSILRPASFASVAKWWIKQMVLLSIKEDANFVKLPVSTWQAYTQLEKARIKLGVGEDKLAEVAEVAKMPLKKAQSIYHTVKIAQVYSLNRTYDHDDKLTLEDIIADSAVLGDGTTDDITELLREHCNAAKLSTQETLIVALRNGMPDLLPEKETPIHDQIKEAVVQNLAVLGYNFKYLTP